MRRVSCSPAILMCLFGAAICLGQPDEPRGPGSQRGLDVFAENCGIHVAFTTLVYFGRDFDPKELVRYFGPYGSDAASFQSLAHLLSRFGLASQGYQKMSAQQLWTRLQGRAELDGKVAVLQTLADGREHFVVLFGIDESLYWLDYPNREAFASREAFAERYDEAATGNVLIVTADEHGARTIQKRPLTSPEPLPAPLVEAPPLPEWVRNQQLVVPETVTQVVAPGAEHLEIVFEAVNHAETAIPNLGYVGDCSCFLSGEPKRIPATTETTIRLRFDRGILLKRLEESEQSLSYVVLTHAPSKPYKKIAITWERPAQ